MGRLGRCARSFVTASLFAIPLALVIWVSSRGYLLGSVEDLLVAVFSGLFLGDGQDWCFGDPSMTWLWHDWHAMGVFAVIGWCSCLWKVVHLYQRPHPSSCTPTLPILSYPFLSFCLSLLNACQPHSNVGSVAALSHLLEVVLYNKGTIVTPHITTRISTARYAERAVEMLVVMRRDVR
jgi:hypothetical protein